jgi:hypothetical protein
VARQEDVTDPDFLVGLAEWPLADVRARRDEANEIETGLSYLRRIVQGRLDIVVAEQRSRSEGGARVDVSDLVEQLPAILGDHVHAPGLGRLPVLMGPGRLDAGLEARLESILPAARLGALGELSDAELGKCVTALSDFESSVSTTRRALFDVLDRLQAEIVRRYQTGEATVDNLLP